MKTIESFVACATMTAGLLLLPANTEASMLSNALRGASGLLGGGGGPLPSTPPGQNNISGTTIRADVQNVVATAVNGGEAAVGVIQTSKSTVRNSTFEVRAKNVVATAVNGGTVKVGLIQN